MMPIVQTSTELAQTVHTLILLAEKHKVGCVYKIPTEQRAVQKIDVGVHRLCWLN